MDLSALLLAMGSGIGWAGLDTCRKMLSQHMQAVLIVVCLTLGQIPLFAVWLVVEHTYRIAPGYVWPASISVVVNTLANLMFVRAVQVSPLSLTVPFLSLTPVFTTLMGFLILREVPTFRQLCGILLVVSGALSIHAVSTGYARIKSMWRAYTGEWGSVLMTCVALLWSINAPFDKLATARSTVALHALVQCGIMTLILLLVLAVRRRLHDLRASKGRIALLLATIGFGTAALGMQLMAFQVMLVSLVEVVKRVIGLVSAVVLGRLLFEETITMQKLRAIGLMSIGIALVLL